MKSTTIAIRIGSIETVYYIKYLLGRRVTSSRLFNWLLPFLLKHKFVVKDSSNEIVFRDYKIEFDLDKLAKLLLEQNYSVKLLYNKELKYLLIGQDIYFQIVKSQREPQYMTFRVSLPLYYGNKPFINSLQIVIVPWFDGLVAIPELEKL